jgi:hypothetical protein
LDRLGSLRNSWSAPYGEREKTPAQEMAMKNKNPVDPRLPDRYSHMDSDELDQEVAKFDQEFSAEGPLR